MVEVKEGFVKCTLCTSKGYCRKHSITKGSSICEQNRGLVPRKERKQPSDQAQSMGLLSYLMRKKEGK